VPAHPEPGPPAAVAATAAAASVCDTTDARRTSFTLLSRILLDASAAAIHLPLAGATACFHAVSIHVHIPCVIRFACEPPPSCGLLCCCECGVICGPDALGPRDVANIPYRTAWRGPPWMATKAKRQYVPTSAMSSGSSKSPSSGVVSACPKHHVPFVKLSARPRSPGNDSYSVAAARRIFNNGWASTRPLLLLTAQRRAFHRNTWQLQPLLPLHR
jgi:hypothetical protein